MDGLRAQDGDRAGTGCGGNRRRHDDAVVIGTVHSAAEELWLPLHGEAVGALLPQCRLEPGA